MSKIKVKTRNAEEILAKLDEMQEIERWVRDALAIKFRNRRKLD